MHEVSTSPCAPRDRGEVMEALALSRAELTVHEEIGGRELLQLLVGLRSMRGQDAHSWNNLSLATTWPDLQAREGALRKTKFFFYRRRAASGENSQLAGVATVADSIRHDFPWEGFPVLGRAFVMPWHRNIGVYRYMLEHRVGYCAQRYGERLKVIHLGSGNPHVSRLVTAGGGSIPTFAHLGDQLLEVGSSCSRVRAFFGFSRAFGRALLDVSPAPSYVAEFQRQLEQALAGARIDPTDFLSRLMSDSLRSWYAARGVVEHQQLVDLLRAVPVIEPRSPVVRSVDGP